MLSRGGDADASPYMDKETLEEVKVELKERYAKHIRADEKKACHQIDRVILQALRRLPPEVLQLRARKALRMTQEDFSKCIRQGADGCLQTTSQEGTKLKNEEVESGKPRSGQATGSDAAFATPAARAVAVSGAAPLGPLGTSNGPSASTPQSARLAAARAQAASRNLRGGSPGGQSLASNLTVSSQKQLIQEKLEESISQLDDFKCCLQNGQDVAEDAEDRERQLEINKRFLERAEKVSQSFLTQPHVESRSHVEYDDGWKF